MPLKQTHLQYAMEGMITRDRIMLNMLERLLSMRQVWKWDGWVFKNRPVDLGRKTIWKMELRAESRFRKLLRGFEIGFIQKRFGGATRSEVLFNTYSNKLSAPQVGFLSQFSAHKFSARRSCLPKLQADFENPVIQLPDRPNI